MIHNPSNHKLENIVWRIIQYHVGRENAISRRDLIAAVRQHGFRDNERKIRLAINSLRMEGKIICASGGKNGGYWLAATPQEGWEYLEKQLHPSALTLLNVEKAVRHAIISKWGESSNAIQERLL